MPNYQNVRSRLNSYNKAAAVLPMLKQIFEQANLVDDAITLYQSASDPDFNAAIDSIFSANERAQLGSMLTNLRDLVTLWEANHGPLLSSE